MSKFMNASNIDPAIRRELADVRKVMLPYCGAFHDRTNQLNAVANTAYPIRLGWTDISRGVSVTNNGSGLPTRILFDHAGIYDIQFSAQIVKTDSNQDDMDIWIRKNGVDVPWTTTRYTLLGNNAKGVAAWDWMVEVALGDYIELMWCSDDTDVLLSVDSGSGLVWDSGVWGDLWAYIASPVRPAIPSVIVTVLPVVGV